MSRNKDVRVKLSEPIHAELEAQAQALGMPFPQYHRHILIEAARRLRRAEPQIQASGFDFEPFDL